MKKALLGLGLLLVGTMAQASDNYFTARVSGTMQNDYNVQTVKGFDVDTNNNMGVSLEYMMKVNEHLDFGLGLGVEGLPSMTSEYNGFYTYKNYGAINGSVKDSIGSSISIPLYVTGKVTFNPNSDFKTYIKADLGFAFNSNTDGKFEAEGTQVSSGIYGKESHEYDVQLSNGAYAGIGLGVELKDITLDVMYKVNLMDARVNGQNRQHADYTRMAMTLGV